MEKEMDDWGEIKLKKIISSGDFWCLIDELFNDKSKFLCNRNSILDAFKEGNLYGLEVNETDSMFERGARMDELFCPDSFYLLPCFCIKEDDKAIIIWVHSRARRKGYGRKLIQSLNINSIFSPLPESIGFWKKMDLI